MPFLERVLSNPHFRDWNRWRFTLRGYRATRYPMRITWVKPTAG